MSAILLIEKYWQVIVGAVAFVLGLVFKTHYDNKIKKETTQKIENLAIKSATERQFDVASKVEEVLLEHANNPLPDTWDELSKESGGNVDTAKRDAFLKILQRKN